MIESSPRTSVLTLTTVALALTVVAGFALVTASGLAQAKEKCRAAGQVYDQLGVAGRWRGTSPVG